MKDNYVVLLDNLRQAKEEKWIITLYRGVTLKFAFQQYNLEPKYNTIEQFAERLFFYGEKSKYFWNDRIGSTLNGQEKFKINDTTEAFFTVIFKEINSLIFNSKSTETAVYFKKNTFAVSFFEKLGNLANFNAAISRKADSEKSFIRNYYLTILHQLGESKYKNKSHFISASSEENITGKFSKKSGIVINFWQLNFNKHIDICEDPHIPFFKGKPYKNQRELSVFTVILPHFIYSFTFKGEIYKNPAIYNVVDFTLVALTGLDVKQDNLENKLHNDTNYSGGVSTDGNTFWEIGI